MFYVYVLHSDKDGLLYTGATGDLKARMEEHNSGRVISTKARLPVRLVYYEACPSQADAFRREKYLKSGPGKRYLKNRLKDSLASLTG
jgi:putative endonuclease